MHWLILIFVLPYLLILLRLYFNLNGIGQFSPAARLDGIRVSVVVACRNESQNIKNLLYHISLQDYPADLFEVIVIDDNSTDSTFESATGFSDIKNLKVLKNTGEGKKRAVTNGVNAATGELLITTDADCRMGKSWLSTIASFYCKYKPDMIICPVILQQGTGLFGKFQELEFLSLQGVTTGSAAGGTSTMCNGANLAFSRETFFRHSGNLHYEIRSGDDVFFLHSLKNEKGSRIFWLEARDAIVTTSQANTPAMLIKQRRRWISKGKAFSDRFTILLAIVTFVTILAQISSLFAGIFYPEFLLMFLVIFTLKSVPDFLILNNTAGRYGRKNLLKWFLPSQVVYPFYVLVVAFSLIGNGKKKEFNFPSPKGI